jgi:hypothetical protein
MSLRSRHSGVRTPATKFTPFLRARRWRNFKEDCGNRCRVFNVKLTSLADPGVTGFRKRPGRGPGARAWAASILTSRAPRARQPRPRRGQGLRPRWRSARVRPTIERRALRPCRASRGPRKFMASARLMPRPLRSRARPGPAARGCQFTLHAEDPTWPSTHPNSNACPGRMASAPPPLPGHPLPRSLLYPAACCPSRHQPSIDAEYGPARAAQI